MTTISGIAHVSLTVRNLRISEAWYRRVLGFERVLEDQTPRFDEVLLAHRDSEAMIGLRQHHIGVTARFDESRTGLDHLALAVPDAVALVDWRKRLRELGVASSELVQHRTGTVLLLRDPDHILVELHCPAPATVWADPVATAAPATATPEAAQEPPGPAQPPTAPASTAPEGGGTSPTDASKKQGPGAGDGIEAGPERGSGGAGPEHDAGGSGGNGSGGNGTAEHPPPEPVTSAQPPGRRQGPGDHRVLQPAHTLDLNADGVAGNEPARRV